MSLKSIGTLYKATYKPRRFFTIRTAPTDGRPIIMRNDAWSHDIVVTWGNPAEHGIESDEEEGWIWQNVAIEKETATAPFDFNTIDGADMEKTTWTHFAITKRATEQLDELANAEGQH